VLIPTEKGAHGIDVMKVPNQGICKNWNEVLKALNTLIEEEHDREWVIVDTISGAEKICSEHICQRDFNGRWLPEPGQTGYLQWGQGDRATCGEFRRVLKALDIIQEEKGMGVILLCHEGLQKSANALGDDFQRFGGTMSKWTWAAVCEWCDQIGHATKDFVAVAEKGKPQAKAKQRGKERWIIFEGNPARDAKSRAGFEMPPRVQLSWDAYYKELIAK